MNISAEAFSTIISRVLVGHYNSGGILLPGSLTVKTTSIIGGMSPYFSFEHDCVGAPSLYLNNIITIEKDPLQSDKYQDRVFYVMPRLFDVAFRALDGVIKATETGPKKCSCDIIDLMNHGCRCGGV